MFFGTMLLTCTSKSQDLPVIHRPWMSYILLTMMLKCEDDTMEEGERPSAKKARTSSHQFRISASSYAKFIDLDCKLFLRQHVDSERSETALSTSLSERMKIRGSEWEKRICDHLSVICSLDSQAVFVDCSKVDAVQHITSVLQTSSTLTHYLYQAKFPIGSEIVPGKLAQVDAGVSKLIPDLLKLSRKSVDDPWALMVIDAKSSLSLKQSHQAQVTFYVYFLELIFTEEIAQGQLCMSPKGGVWLQPSHADNSVSLLSSIQEFHLKPWLQLLQQHLQREIPDALSCSIEDVPWHLNTNCASCPYLESCKSDKPYGADIRALPHVTSADSKLLQDLAKRRPSTVDPDRHQDHRSVRALLASLLREVDPSGPSYEHQRALRAIGATVSPAPCAKPNTLGALTSIVNHDVLVRDQRCGTFPNNDDDCPVYVSLCCDPANELPFACAVRSFPGENFAETTSYSGDQGDTRHQQEQLLVHLLEHLCEMVDMACAKSVSPRLTFYVWEPLERTCLTQLVIRALCGDLSHLIAAVPDLTARVHYLALVLLDYPDQWDLHTTPSPEYNPAATPRICDVVGQFRALVHLPIRGFYSPCSIASCMQAPDSDAPDISVDSIERDWTQLASAALTRLSSRICELTVATRFLRGKVAKKLLFNKSAALPSRSAVQRCASSHPVLQRLVFMKHVNALVRCSEKRQKRIASWNNPELEIRLRCQAKHEQTGDFELISGPPVFADKCPRIRKWCLARANAETIVNFFDLMYLAKPQYCDKREVAFVSVDFVTSGANVGSLCIELPKGFVVNVGDECVLFEREVDFTLVKAINSLESLSDSLTSAGDTAIPTAPRSFIDLIEDPNEWSARACSATGLCAGTVLSGVPCGALESARGCVDSFYQAANVIGEGGPSPFASVGPLSGAQAKAFQSLLHGKLTILWGPPGTGKTHFTAKSVLNLIEMLSQQRSGTHLRVLVCATTHAAINEVLKKFVALKTLALKIPNRTDTTPWKACKVIKFEKKESDPDRALEGVMHMNAPTKVVKDNFVVVGTTVWALYNEKDPKTGKLGIYFKGLFDVVVIDEASQMPVSDALMPLNCLKEGPGGRLLVVGDTLQLSRIFAYKFGPPPPGVPPVQSSVLECFLRTASNHPVDLSAVVDGREPPPPRMTKLNENFRMNTALSKFTSLLYGSDYVPSTSSRNHSGSWAVDDNSDLRRLLPKVFPCGSTFLPELVSIRLVPRCATTGLLLSADELLFKDERAMLQREARAVADLIVALSTSQSGTSPDDLASQFFACTPHNNQKSSLAHELRACGHPSWSAIADTPERMQGQERDVVVICLGFLSAELVAREIDFLFSKKRLNVAISRAKKSCIVVYTDAMVALNPAVIGNIEASEAYAHLLAFIDSSVPCDYVVTL